MCIFNARLLNEQMSLIYRKENNKLTSRYRCIVMMGRGPPLCEIFHVKNLLCAKRIGLTAKKRKIKKRMILTQFVNAVDLHDLSK